MTPTAEHPDVSHWLLKPSQIIALRNRLGKTQLQFAQMLSVDPSSVGRWESGRACPRQVYVRMITRIMQEHSR